MAILTPLTGLTLRQIEDSLASSGIDRTYALRVAYWIYRKRVGSFSEMTNIAGGIREKLSESFSSGFLRPAERLESADGSVKYLFDYPGGRKVETVFMPETRRNTVCVSSQSGCTRGCLYCRTGEMGLKGNLTAAEIVNQVLAIPESARLTHVVFMGMGEPLDNLQAVVQAIEILTAEWGLSIAHSRITVSTVGILPAVEQFLAKTRSNLTLSILSPISADRARLVPAERLFPAEKIMSVIRETAPSRRRRISLAYMMLEGINDTDSHLDALIKLISGTTIRVNLLRYHQSGNIMFRQSAPERMNLFRERLLAAGISASVRRSRGEDIGAACGLLGAGEC
ncbi:MAG: radical SAM protein [Bacteroidetes bacterium]|nr:radical SAM protein [Bacteroidota bacterium]